jgi:hypothetical protein
MINCANKENNTAWSFQTITESKLTDRREKVNLALMRPTSSPLLSTTAKKQSFQLFINTSHNINAEYNYKTPSSGLLYPSSQATITTTFQRLDLSPSSCLSKNIKFGSKTPGIKPSKG